MTETKGSSMYSNLPCCQAVLAAGSTTRRLGPTCCAASYTTWCPAGASKLQAGALVVGFVATCHQTFLYRNSDTTSGAQNVELRTDRGHTQAAGFTNHERSCFIVLDGEESLTFVELDGALRPLEIDGDHRLCTESQAGSVRQGRSAVHGYRGVEFSDRVAGPHDIEEPRAKDSDHQEHDGGQADWGPNSPPHTRPGRVGGGRRRSRLC